LEDSAGTLWIGTAEGPAFLKSGRVQVPPQLPEPLHEEIFGMAEDANGWLWIATSSRVLQVKRDKLIQGSVNGDLRAYGVQDGLAGGGVRRDRSVIADPGGRIWLSLNHGISVVDPARLTRQSAPPIVNIQTISADGAPLDLHNELRIPADRHRIVFSYAGLSLSSPERVKYRYMLDGFDQGWSEPTAAREAGYTNLGPGKYRFHVIASNGAGLWNGAEAAAALQVDPMFWQTWWFYACTALAGGFAVVGIVLLRMRQLTGQLNLRFEERLAERTRIAQELHDTLLQGFLSASMRLHVAVDALPEDSPAKPPLDGILDLMRRVIDEGRNTLQGLRSSYGSAISLEQSFASIPDELLAGEETEFRVIVEGQPKMLHPVLRDEIYRIGREALVNAFRHSRATSVEMELEYLDRELRVHVRDNGCGIDPEVLRSGSNGHWGLSGMRERAEKIGARFHVWSSTTSGTEVQLSVPGHIAFQSQPSNRLKWFGIPNPRRTNGNHP
jgi:signal transduction histidine kinase